MQSRCLVGSRGAPDLGCLSCQQAPDAWCCPQTSTRPLHHALLAYACPAHAQQLQAAQHKFKAFANPSQNWVQAVCAAQLAVHTDYCRCLEARVEDARLLFCALNAVSCNCVHVLRACVYLEGCYCQQGCSDCQQHNLPRLPAAQQGVGALHERL